MVASPRWHRDAIWIGIVLGAFGCEDRNAQAAELDRIVERVDIGTRPPGFKIELNVSLRPLSSSARLESIRSTCSCLHVSLSQEGRTITAEAEVPGQRPLLGKIVFIPKGRFGSIDDMISFTFRKADGSTAIRVAQIVGALDPAVSVVAEHSGDLALVLPDSVIQAQLPLREPFALDRIKFPKVSWLSVTPLEGDGVTETACLDLRLGPFRKPQQKRFKLEFPLEGGGTQVFPMTVRVQAPERFEPQELVLRLEEGGETMREVDVIGQGISARMPHQIRWVSEKGPHVARIQSELVPVSSSRKSHKLLLRVTALVDAGVTESCHLEFLPRKGSPYWLSLPILIRIRKGDSHE